MLTTLLQKLGLRRWLPWIGMSPFVAIPVAIMMGGELWQGLGVLAVLCSFFAGISLGSALGQVMSIHVFKRSSEFGERLSAGLAGFGAFFLPPIIGFWSNHNLGTDIGLSSLWQHHLWACVAGLIFFCAKPAAAKS
jgi:hypothetical protein